MSTGSAGDVDPEREVRRLHLMLGDWFAGVRDDLKPFEGSMADEFTAVMPDGRVLERDAYRAALDEERAALGRARIEIDEITVQRSLYGVHHLTFEKRVLGGEEPDVRTGSIWVRETERTATGLQLLHLSETPKTIEPDED